MNKKQLRMKQKLINNLKRKIIGYHVYRSTDPNLPFELWERLTDQPIAEGDFSDPAAEIGKQYFYQLTQIFDDRKESAPITPKSSYTDHAGKTFAQNPLKDLTGYNIYRSADKNIPLENWERRNSEPLLSLEFKDEGVVSGEVFFYYIRGVDSRGIETSSGEIMQVTRK